MSGYDQFFQKKRQLAKPKKAGKKISLPKPAKSPSRGTRSGNLWLILIVSVLSGAGLWYLSGGDVKVAQFLNRVDVTLGGEAVAGEAKAAEDKPKAEEKKSSEAASGKDAAKASPKTWTDEEVALFSKLEDRKKELDSREANLNKLEEELQRQKDELEKRMTSLEQMRTKIAGKLEDKVKGDGDKVTALVSVYSNMKPAQAATVIAGLNEDLAVEVLTKMKNKNAAEILNVMDAEKAKHLSEKFAGFRDPASVSQN